MGNLINERNLSGSTKYAGSSKGVTIAGASKVYSTIADRDADTGTPEFAFVRDARSDPTVKTGFAIYYRTGSGWKKIFEEEAMDRDITELVRFNWNALVDGPTSLPEAIDAAVQKAHEHDNKLTLDKIGYANGYLTYNGQVLKSNPIKFTKWLQLVRPPTTHNINAVDCKIEIYPMNNPSTPIAIINSLNEYNHFKYYDGLLNPPKFVDVGADGIPTCASGRFVIADIYEYITDETVFIKWEWSAHASNTVISTNMCVYPSITPTNTESAGLVWLEE